MKLEILYEDNHLIAVEKPAGIITQRDSTGRLSLIDMVKEYIREKYDKPGEVFLGAVHRLDRTVSGPVLFARTSKAAGRLFDEFKYRRVLKLYAALVHNPAGAGEKSAGTPEWKTLSHHLERKRDTTKIAQRAGIKTKDASLRYSVLGHDDRYALLLVHLLTGRKHQIRAQLAAIGCPIVGDLRYGAHDPGDPDAIGLHSCHLRFIHPTLKIPIAINSKLPERIASRLSPDIPLDEIAAKISWEELP
ncbi:MAG TPA: RluA family pseudouridine synthase [Spirochaetota bacterium]|nr:RluA family pseudouridine synthase [Spirochaetota bacterium]